MAAESYMIPVYVKTLTGEIIQLSVDRYLKRQGVHDALCSAYPDEFPYDLTHVTDSLESETEPTSESDTATALELESADALAPEMIFLAVVTKDTMCRLLSVKTRLVPSAYTTSRHKVRHWTFMTSNERVYHIYRVIHQMERYVVKGTSTSNNGPFSIQPYAYYAISEDEPLSDEVLQRSNFYHRRVPELFYVQLAGSSPTLTFHDVYVMELIVDHYEQDIGDVRRPTKMLFGREMFFCECGHVYESANQSEYRYHLKTGTHLNGHPSNRAFMRRAKAYVAGLPRDPSLKIDQIRSG